MKKIFANIAELPLPVTILAVFVLFITSWHIIRVYSAIANWQVLREFGANPAYILGTGLFWTLAGLWLFWLFWDGRQPALRAGLGSAGLYLAWYWLDRLVIQPSPATNAVFSAIVSAILFAIFTLGLLLPPSRAFFNHNRRRQNERQSQEDSNPA
jgi:hypothetical protein